MLSVFLIGIPLPAKSQVVLSGILLGADGQPMQKAHVWVEDGPTNTDTTHVAMTDRSGRFSLTLSEPGGYGMYVMGVHHDTQEFPLVVTEAGSVELEVRLAAISPTNDIDSVWVVTTTPDDQGILMDRLDDNLFTARIAAETDTLAYQVRFSMTSRVGFTYDITVAGTQYDRIAFNPEGPFWDHDGDYYSVIDNVDGHVDITFDPAYLSVGDTEITFQSNPATIAGVAAIYVDVEERERKIGFALRDSDGDQMPNDFEAFLAELRAPVRDHMEKEQDPLLRQWLMMRYFDELEPTDADSLLARQTLDTVRPDSPLWSYEAWYHWGASNQFYSISSIAQDSVQKTAYVQRVIDQHPDPDVRAQFLQRGTEIADHMGNDELKWRYYAQLQSEHGDTSEAEEIRREFSVDRAVQAGRPAPAFSFVSLEDANVTYTDQDLRQNIYLIDFWGTWCAPCIKELPDMHTAYETYHDLGFEILSVSMMEDSSSVATFRNDQYPMPWLHTVVSREDDSAVRKNFEITSFPRPILVNKEGMIIATDDVLREGKLLDVLADVFKPE